MAIALLF